jgi:hypothetical protein
VAEDRKRKEAEALRANLLQRKAQQRARAEKEKTRGGAGAVQDGHSSEPPAAESIAGEEQHQ